MSASECYTCSKLTIERCTGCKKTFFCSQTCQKIVFRTHKLHCQEVESPITIRQPAFTRGEFDIMMEVAVNINDPFNAPVVTWRGYTEVQKQKHFEGFRSKVESCDELLRHQTLLLDRKRVLHILQDEQSSSPYKAFCKTTGLVPFYGMIPIEFNLGFQGSSTTPVVYKKFYKLFFNYFLLLSVEKIYDDDAYPFASPAYHKMVEEVKNLESQKVKHWERIEGAMQHGLEYL